MQPIDQDKLNQFLGTMVNDMGAAMTAALVIVGDRLGLYKALAGEPATATELAARTGTAERYIREWLSAQAAAGYVRYDPETRRFTLDPEQALVFADEDSPAFLAGFGDIVQAAFRDEPKITAAFKSGKGVGWHERDRCLFCGTERFFRTTYKHHLVQEWLPALDGMLAKLERGAKVADVGCGHGISTLLMAQAYPNSTFHGFDYHPASVEEAKKRAADAGVAGNTMFETAAAKTYPGRDYDLVCCFDSLHDMGDPIGAAAHVHDSLKPDGIFMVVEPFAHDRLEDNINPVGRVYYAASTMICTPASLDQEVGLALGAQAGEARLREVLVQGGFTRIRRAAETPFNMVLEARV